MSNAQFITEEEKDEESENVQFLDKYLKIEVKDTGIGISQENQKLLFKYLDRIDTSV